MLSQHYISCPHYHCSYQIQTSCHHDFLLTVLSALLPPSHLPAVGDIVTVWVELYSATKLVWFSLLVPRPSR